VNLKAGTHSRDWGRGRWKKENDSREGDPQQHFGKNVPKAVSNRRGVPLSKS